MLDHCLIAQHRQTWKLREYQLPEHQELAREGSRPLGLGDPLKAHFPTGTRILQEFSDSVDIQEPGTDTVHYWRPSHAKFNGQRVKDIIILGEVLCFSSWMQVYSAFCKGHSAWGQFNLYGRVRPLDGLISLSKQYV